MKRILPFLIVSACIVPSLVLSQTARLSRFEVSGIAGISRISMDRFDDFYDSRVAYPIGGSVDYAISPTFHLSVRGKTFKKSATFSPSFGPEVDLELKQSWIGLGIQRVSLSFSGRSRTFFGFGVAFFFVEENEEGLLADLNIDSKTTNPKGFFLDIGVDRYVTRNIAIRFEIEAASAAVGGGFGAESQSFGGIFFGLGLNLNLF